MKMLLALLLFIPWMAHADLHLASPDQLLQKASQGRIPLREVILDISQNVEEMHDPATFDSYFGLLDQLQVYADQFKLDEIYPKAVSGLGLRMASNGIRWLDLTKDDTTRVLYYFKWMDGDTANLLESNIEFQALDLKDPAKIKNMITNVDALIPLAEVKFKDRTDLLFNLRRFSSDFAVKYLEIPGVTEQDIQFWIPRIRLSSSVSDYIDFVNLQISLVAQANSSLLHTHLAHFILVNATINAEPTPAPLGLVNQLGDSVQNLLIRMTQYEEFFQPGEFEQALGLLKVRQLQSLAQQWEGVEKLPSQKYASHFLQLCRALADALGKVGLTKDADDLSKWTSRQAAPIQTKNLQMEGNYALTDLAGKAWNFTIVQARDNVVYAALVDSTGAVYKVFFNVTYDVQTSQFVASEREPDIDGVQNPPIKFSLDDSGQITVTDLFARIPTAKVLKGRKTQNFPDLLTQGSPQAPSVDGTYEGTLTFPATGPGAQPTEFSGTLIVTVFDGYSLGRLSTMDGMIDIDFNMGTKGDNGVLYLTTLRNNRTTWVQLRATLTQQGLQGYVIVGGRGISPKPFLLKKK